MFKKENKIISKNTQYLLYQMSGKPSSVSKQTNKQQQPNNQTIKNNLSMLVNLASHRNEMLVKLMLIAKGNSPHVDLTKQINHR